MTFLSFDVTASTISVFVRLPLPSASMSGRPPGPRSGTCSLKASSSRRSAAAWASRGAALLDLRLKRLLDRRFLRCDRPVSAKRLDSLAAAATA